MARVKPAAAGAAGSRLGPLVRRLRTAGEPRSRRIALAFSTGLAAKVAAVLPQILAVPLVIGSIGVVEFGKFATISSALTWVAVTSLGTGPGLTQRLAAAHGEDDHDLEATLFSSSLAAVGAACLVSALLVIAGGAALVLTSGLSTEDLAIGAVLASAVLVQLLLSPVDSALLAYQEMHWTNVMAGIASVATVIAVVVIAVRCPSVWAFAAALGWTPSVFKVANLVLLVKRRPYLMPSPKKSHRATAVALLGVGVLFLGIQLAPLISQQGAIIVTAASIGPAAAAETSVLVRLLALAGAPILVATQALWPAIIDARSQGDAQWIRMALARTLAFSTLYTLAFGLAMLLGGTRAIGLWSAGGVDVDPGVLAVFAASFVFIAWTHVFAIVLIGLGHVRFVSIVLTLESLLALALMVALRPILGLAAPWFAMICTGALVTCWLFPARTIVTLRHVVAGPEVEAVPAFAPTIAP